MLSFVFSLLLVLLLWLLLVVVVVVSLLACFVCLLAPLLALWVVSLSCGGGEGGCKVVCV